MGLIVVLGLGLIAVSRGSRDATASPRVGKDHWHAVYDVYDCASDSFMPAFGGNLDPHGIHSHNDGLMHIHPFDGSASGADAKLGVFLDSMGATVTTNEISSPDFATLQAGVDCGGQPSVIKVARFQVDPEIKLVKVYDSDFSNIHFDHNREAFTIARVAPDQDPPQPEADRFDALNQATGSPQESTGPVTTDGGHGNSGATTDSSTTTSVADATGATTTTVAPVTTTAAP